MDSIDQPIKSERMDRIDQSMEPETVDNIDQSMEQDVQEEQQEIRRAYEAKIKNLERSLEVCRVTEDSLFGLIHQMKVREERL